MKGGDGCTGKIRHTKVGAIIAAKKMKNKQMSPYHCHRCSGWHIGHSNSYFKIQQRISQLLGQK